MNAPVIRLVTRARCRRMFGGKRCHALFSEHVDGKCPVIEAEFLAHKPQALDRAGTSFDADELELASAILAAVLSGTNVQQHARSKAFVGFARKVHGMVARVRAKKASAR